MTPADKLKRKAIGAKLDHRPVYIEERDALAILDLIAENERMTNNRDMWRGQCERQAETLTQATVRIGALENACRAAHRFVQEERENRESAGGDMTDYVGEAREVEDLLASALGIAVEEIEEEENEEEKAA